MGPYCRTGKMVYRNRLEAKIAKEAIESRGKRIMERYKCPFCHRFHLKTIKEVK